MQNSKHPSKSDPDPKKFISDTQHKKKRCSPILKLARGVEPGWVEIMPRKRVTLQVRTWLYSEQTDTRYFSDSVTFVTGDLESTQRSESTHCCTRCRRIPGTSQTASPSSRATWRVHRGQRVHMVVLRADGYQVLHRLCHLCYVKGDLESTHGSKSTVRYGATLVVLYPKQTDAR